MMIFGTIQKEDLSRFFNETSVQNFRELNLSISLLKGYIDNDIMKDQSNEFLDNIPKEIEDRIANQLEEIEEQNKRDYIKQKWCRGD